jgi:hypothetical protein
MWLRELLQPSVLPSALLAKVIEPLAISDNFFFDHSVVTAYGLGQITFNYAGHRVAAHTGSILGQKSLVIRFLDKGFDIMIAVNDDELGAAFIKTVAWTIVDDLLEVEGENWEDYFMTPVLFDHTPTVNLPSTLRSPPSAREVVGDYFDAGYGNSTLKVAKGMTTTEGSSPTYLAEFGVASVPLTHYDGPLFNWTAAVALPLYNESGRTGEIAVLKAGSGTVLVAPDGLAWFGLWGAGSALEMRIPNEEDPKSSAEVWFEKRGG